MTKDEPRSLGMPLELAREQLLADPNTRQIAAALGVEVREYVERVLEYARHPTREPELFVLDQETLEAHEDELPSEAEVLRWFEGVASGQIAAGPRALDLADGFSSEDEPAQAALEVAGASTAARAPMVEEVTRRKGASSPRPASGLGAVLKKQLFDQQQRARLATESKRTGAAAPRDEDASKKKR
jgi:hypothetical protein